jgi:predicted Zn finger-like uncharacterized protein
MSLNVACPSCQTRYNLPEKFAGKKVKCKSCGKPFAATVGAAKATTTKRSVATRQQEADPKELSKMGIDVIRQQQDPFAAEPHLGPDPLRNHVVQDPGFGGATGIPGQTNPDDEESGVDPDFASVTSNPYIATIPKVNHTAATGNEDHKPKKKKNASQGKRLTSFFVDQVFFWIVGFAAGFASVFIIESEIVGQIVLYAFNITFMFLYYVILEASCGRTIGKLIAGTKVVNDDGGRVSFGRVLGRTLCRFIPFEPFSFVFGGDNAYPTGWHDSIPRTRVIDA